ncbi:MAG: hypothetical protein Tsb0033_07300 [Winogradskyella sp.]
MVKLNVALNASEFEIPLEEIDVQKIVKQTTTGILPILIFLLFAFLFIFFSLMKIFGDSEVETDVLIFIFLVASSMFFMAYMNRKKLILIPTLNNGVIEMFNGRPNVEMTDRFIKELKEKTLNLLKTKYGAIDKDLPIEPQLNNIVWLRDRDILTQVEFESLKQQLLSFNKAQGNIGFGD